MSKQATILSLLTILLIPTIAWAGIETLINNVFPSGTMSNVTRQVLLWSRKLVI